MGSAVRKAKASYKHVTPDQVLLTSEESERPKERTTKVKNSRNLLVKDNGSDKAIYLKPLRTSRNQNSPSQNRIVHVMRRIKTAEIAGDKKAELMAYKELMAILNKQEDIIENGKKYLELAKEVGDKKAEAIALLSISKACISTKRYNDAIQYCEKCYHLSKRIGDKQIEMKVCLMLAKTYSALCNYNLVIVYGNKCREIAVENDDEHTEAMAFTWIHSAYMNKASILASKAQSEGEIVDTVILSSDKLDILSAYRTLVVTLISERQYYEAVENCRRYLELAKEYGDEKNKTDAYLLLAKAYEKLNQTVEDVP